MFDYPTVHSLSEYLMESMVDEEDVTELTEVVNVAANMSSSSGVTCLVTGFVSSNNGKRKGTLLV